MSSSHVPGLPDRYEVVSLVGQGGMGRVWLAHDRLLNRPVAVKEVIAPPAEQAKVRADVLREARAAVRVRDVHPNVIQVYDVVDKGPNPLIIMEYVPGRSLAQVLSDEGTLSADRTREIGLAVLAALVKAHDVGVLHRDVKPANILIRDDGRIVLTDFGVAKIVDVSADHHSRHVRGTPEYLAPERFQSTPASPACDLWSLGVTLYACLTGQSPFERDNPYATMMAVFQHDPAPVGDQRLDALLRGLLQKDPDRRIDADTAATLLRPAPPSPTRVLPPAPPRRRRRWRLVAAALVIVLGASGFTWWRVHWPADPHLPVLQAFAGGQRLSSCRSGNLNANQLAKRECDAGHGIKVYWILYRDAGERDAHYATFRDCEPATCLRRDRSVSPSGARGHYAEFVASDGRESWAGLWWDDEESNPDGAAALEIHGPYDGNAREPALALRELWKGWGYRLGTTV